MAGGSSPLVSIVDDDRAAREALLGLVKSLGFSVRGFASAQEFLDSGSATQSACLILDMRMPEITGLELHRHLIAQGFAVPTILVTAYPDPGLRQRAQHAGIAEYLVKPPDPDLLLRCLRRVIEFR